jgi:hypothetical protein
MDEFQIIDGVRRAKAAQLAGHATILAEIMSRQGTIESTVHVQIGALRSPKQFIQRITSADEQRWQRAVRGAQQQQLPYPPILIRRGSRGILVADVDFDFGAAP